MKNIFSVFTKKGTSEKVHSNFIDVAGKGKQTYVKKNILEELEKELENLVKFHEENKNSFVRNSLVIGRTDNCLSRTITLDNFQNSK